MFGHAEYVLGIWERDCQLRSRDLVRMKVAKASRSKTEAVSTW